MEEEKTSRVQVHVRVRPPTSLESTTCCVEVDATVAAVSVRLDSEAARAAQGGDAWADEDAAERREFTFDGVFTPSASQSDVFMRVGWPVLKGCLKGINGTVLAYGQTGSGKTYSLLNTEQDMECVGLLPCLVASLFVHITHDSGSVYQVEAAALQVYNEQIDDLMHPQHQSGGGHGLTVQNGGVVPGLTWVRCDSPITLLDAFLLARSNVVYADTLLNKVANRSHAIFQLRITRSPKGDLDNFTHARLCVVDLAGSERVKRSGVAGTQLRESTAINKSLLAFGNVVSALAAKKSHVPIRDSKLTRILDGSIGGNCKTALLVCVSPTTDNMHETLNSLEFASRAMRVEVDARVNRGFLGVNTKSLMKDLSGRIGLEQSKEQEVLSLRFPESCWPAPLQFEDAFWRALGNLWADRLSELVRLVLRPCEGALLVELLAPRYIIKELNQLPLAELSVMGHTAISVDIWKPSTDTASAEVMAEVKRLRSVLEEEEQDEGEEEPAPEEPPPGQSSPPPQGAASDSAPPTPSDSQAKEKRSVSFAPSSLGKSFVTSSVEAVERAVERAEIAVESAERSAEEWRARAEAAEAQTAEVEAKAREAQQALEQWRLRAGIAEAAVEVMKQLQMQAQGTLVTTPPLVRRGSLTESFSSASGSIGAAISQAIPPTLQAATAPAAMPAATASAPAATLQSAAVQAVPVQAVAVPAVPSAVSSSAGLAQAEDPRLITERGVTTGGATAGVTTGGATASSASVHRRNLSERPRLSGVSSPEVPAAGTDVALASTAPVGSPRSTPVAVTAREVHVANQGSAAALEPSAAAMELAHREAEIFWNKALLRDQKRQLMTERTTPTQVHRLTNGAATPTQVHTRTNGAATPTQVHTRSYPSLREPQLLADLEERKAPATVQQTSPRGRLAKSSRSVHEPQVHSADNEDFGKSGNVSANVSVATRAPFRLGPTARGAGGPSAR